jgi:hypothetical protein
MEACKPPMTSGETRSHLKSPFWNQGKNPVSTRTDTRKRGNRFGPGTTSQSPLLATGSYCGNYEERGSFSETLSQTLSQPPPQASPSQ